MLTNLFGRTTMREHPFPRGAGIGQGFHRGKCFGSDHEQSRFRISIRQRISHMATIDIRHKMQRQIFL